VAIIHLENVSADLMRRIERLAKRVRQTPEATIIQLLEEAVPRDPNDARKHVRAILDRIRQNPIVPTPGMPDSVELLREDRNR
jgi:FMN phosphatase YigB (HAD superfamily)